jgi:hypothetical protein
LSTSDRSLVATTTISLEKLDDEALFALNTAINVAGNTVPENNESYAPLLEWGLIDIAGTATDLPSLCEACVAVVISRMPTNCCSYNKKRPLVSRRFFV